AGEIGDKQARSVNLALTMQCPGLEQTIPLRLSNEDIGKLALEAELREISLGQLVGMLIEAAMAQAFLECSNPPKSQNTKRLTVAATRKLKRPGDVAPLS